MADDLELYIEVDKDGNYINHPILGDNIRFALGIEPSQESKYQPFKRVPYNDKETPVFLTQRAYSSYEKIDNIWTDVWHVVYLEGSELLERENIIQQYITTYKQEEINFANNLISKQTNQSNIDLLNSYINDLENFTLIDYNVVVISFPKRPALIN